VKNFVLQAEVVVGICFQDLTNGFYPFILTLSLLNSMSDLLLEQHGVCTQYKASTCFILVPGRCSNMFSKSCKNIILLHGHSKGIAVGDDLNFSFNLISPNLPVRPLIKK